MSERIKPFDTLIAEGMLFCSEGTGNNPRGHLSYIQFPNGDKTDRNGVMYKKMVLEGKQGEDEKLGLLDSRTRQIVNAFYQVDPITGEVFLQVPAGMDYTHIPSVRALQDILDGSMQIPQQYVDNIGLAIDWIINNTDIRRDDLGLYGGFGAGIFKPFTGEKTDVDLTIYGEKYVESVRAMSRQNASKGAFAPTTAKANEWLQRGFQAQQSAIRIGQRTAHPLNASFVIDTWVVRGDNDPNITVPVVEDPSQVSAIQLSVEIATADQSLALPAYYGAHIKGSNTLVNIFSNRFHYLASMLEGQQVELTGLEIETGVSQERTIVLTDPLNHRISYISD